MKNLFSLIIFFFVFGNTNWAQSNNTLFTKIIDENKTEISEKNLKQKFSLLIENTSKSDKNNLIIIYQVLLANLISKQGNDINTRSTHIYNDALLRVEQTDNLGFQIWVESQIGFYYYKFYKYDNASNFFLNTSRLLNENLDSEIVDPITVLKYNAYFFTSINEKRISNQYLKRAIKITPKTTNDYAAFLNAIGTNYFDLGDYQLANQYFNETIKYAKQNKDSLRLAKGLGDLAQIYILNKKYSQAEKLLQRDIEISKQFNNPKNEMFANIRLGNLFIMQNKNEQAKQIFNYVLNYVKTQNTLKSWESDVNKALLSIAISDNNENEELVLRRKIDYLRPIVDTIDGAEVLKKLSWKNQNEIANWKFESEQIKLEKASFMKTTFIVISFLLFSLLLLLIFIYKRRFKLQQVNYENSILIAQLKQLKIENDLNEANDSLKSIKSFLIDKNNQIVKLESQINSLEQKSILDHSQEKIELDKLISSHLMTEDNWLVFKQSFVKEEPELYNTIKTNFPDMSESNLRIVLLHKIGLKNQEIANLLGITIHGVKKAKQRLRIKYGEAIEELV